MKSIELLNLSNQEFKKKEIILTHSSGDYPVVIDQKFKETEIMKLVQDLVVRSQYCSKHDLEFNVVENIYLLIVKYFTDIKFSKFKSTEKQYNHEIDVLGALINLGLFKQLIEAFDPKEIEQISQIFEKYKESFKAINNTIVTELMKEDGVDGEL